MYVYSPGFGHNHLPLMDLHSKTMPKVVATKMLSASSIHPKMQLELGKTRYILCFGHVNYNSEASPIRLILNFCFLNNFPIGQLSASRKQAKTGRKQDTAYLNKY